MTNTSHSKRVPPAKPNPSKILDEARMDFKAGRHADALAKHVWFHQNALIFERALYGVRLSFALGAWCRLGELYTPALTTLKAVRSQARIRVREGRKGWEAFHDFLAINHELGEHDETEKLFIWLVSNRPHLAKRVYELAEPSLVRRRKYRLCGRYLTPERSYRRFVELYRTTVDMARKPKFGRELREFAKRSFAQSTATLVGLLVLNGRTAQAKDIVFRAMKERRDNGFRTELKKALRGKVPVPWPR